MGRAIRYIVVVVGMTALVTFLVHVSDIGLKHQARVDAEEARRASSPHLYIKPRPTFPDGKVHFDWQSAGGENQDKPREIRFKWTNRHVRVLDEGGHTLFSSAYQAPGRT